MHIVAYSYESVFLENSGDHARIRSIHNFIGEETGEDVVCFCLGSKFAVHKRKNSIYVEYPRRFGHFLRRFLALKKSDSLNHNLDLLTQIIFDEPFLVMQTLKFAKQADALWVHGDMSVVPLTLRLLGFRGRIVMDSMANYPQTLYMRLRNVSLFNRALAYTRLGIYLVCYRAQLRASDRVLYPSSFDADNSKKMYALKDKVKIVPNLSSQFCTTPTNLNRLRQKYREKLGIKKNNVVLLFCGGLRSKANKDALELLVSLTPEQLGSKNEITLLVTGPWQDYRMKAKLPSVFTGIVERDELKFIFAASDIALAPIFESSGTLLKVLEYLSAGLPIVTTSMAIAGLSSDLLDKGKIYVAKDETKFRSELSRALGNETCGSRSRAPSSNNLFSQEHKLFSESLRGLLGERNP